MRSAIDDMDQLVDPNDKRIKEVRRRDERWEGVPNIHAQDILKLIISYLQDEGYQASKMTLQVRCCLIGLFQRVERCAG